MLANLPVELHQLLNSCEEQVQLLLKEQKCSANMLKQPYQQLLKVFCCSDFVARVVKAQPLWFFNCLGEGIFEQDLSEQQLNLKMAEIFELKDLQQQNQHLLQNRLSLSQHNQIISKLRILRQQCMVHIAWRDILAKASLNETMHSLSNLADAYIQTALHYLQQQLKVEFGIPVDATGRELEMIVLAMGKLGAQELNFSSDIDLIFVFPEQGKTINTRRSISHHEFFIKLGQQLIKLLNETTADGFIFRVDMRLRPFGKSGPIATSIDAMSDYYALHGREWERYALIKARMITGQSEDQALLQVQLKAFTYRRYIDFSVFESLREMKQLIAHEVALKHMYNHIKLGSGGIRSIEFMVQAFQLLRGGREPELQRRAVQKIIPLLQAKAYISERVANDLLSAYQFLRNTEHRLQELNDQQTHLLPEHELARARIAYAMGFENWQLFIEQLTEHRNKVEAHFSQLFLINETDTQHPLQIFWCKTLAHMETLEREELRQYQIKTATELELTGLSSTAEIIDLLLVFRQSSNYRKMSSEAKIRLDKLMPEVLTFLSQASENKTDLTSSKSYQTLKRLIALFESICRRSVYMVLLLENKQALAQLIKLCARSIWISRELTKNPILLDELLDPRLLFAPLNKKDLKSDLNYRLRAVDKDDLEQQMEILRHFKLSHVLRVAATDITAAINTAQVSNYLTWIAETILQQIIAIAWLDTAKKMSQAQTNASKSGFAVIGYGKIGGVELGYSSDLDLVFIYADHLESKAHFFIRLGQRIMFLLAMRSYSGILYECDMRLRPNGNSGLIACSLSTFTKYELEKAWLWEHQALCRARLVAGDSYMSKYFIQARRLVLCQPRELVTLQQQVGEMREKMSKSLLKKSNDLFDIKQSPGALVDIEFMIQFLILRYAHQNPEIIQYSDNIHSIQSLEKNKLLSKQQAENLTQIYLSYRHLIHRNALQEQAMLCPISYFAKQQKQIKAYWHEMIESR